VFGSDQAGARGRRRPAQAYRRQDAQNNIPAVQTLKASGTPQGLSAAVWTFGEFRAAVFMWFLDGRRRGPWWSAAILACRVASQRIWHPAVGVSNHCYLQSPHPCHALPARRPASSGQRFSVSSIGGTLRGFANRSWVDARIKTYAGR